MTETITKKKRIAIALITIPTILGVILLAKHSLNEKWFSIFLISFFIAACAFQSIVMRWEEKRRNKQNKGKPSNKAL